LPNDDPPSPKKNGDHSRLVLLLACALLLLPLLGPALLRLGSAFLGEEGVDGYGTVWFYWLVGRQLGAGEGLLHTDLIFHPIGKDILLDSGANLLDALAAWPLQALLGPMLGYNLFLLLAIGLSGWAFYKLAREFSDDLLACGMGSLLFVCSPYALFELAQGRPTQGLLGLLPLFLLCAWRASTSRPWRWPLLAGLVLALMGYQYWFYALFTGLICLGLAPALALRARRERSDPGPAGVLLRFALIGTLALALVLPVALPVLRAVGDGQMRGMLQVERWTLSSISLGTTEGVLAVLSSWQPLSLTVADWTTQHGAVVPSLSYSVTPWISLLLVCVYLLRPGRLPRGPWAAITLIAAVLAIGPLLVVGSYNLGNPLYILLVKLLPVMRRLWWPLRAYAWIAVTGSLAAVMAIHWLSRFGRRPQALAALAASAILVVELWFQGILPFPVWAAPIPAGYRCLAASPEGAVVELPYAFTQVHLYHQTIHGHPISGGMAEERAFMVPEGMRRLAAENSYLRSLLQAASRSRIPGTLEWSDGDRQALGQLGYRYALLNKDAYTPALGSMASEADRKKEARRLAVAQQALRRVAGEPLYDDARTALYSPWGAPLPCDPASLAADERTRQHITTVDEKRSLRQPWKKRRAPPSEGPPRLR